MPSLIEKHYAKLWNTYDTMVRSVMNESTALDLKTKELIAIVISIINRCETCIDYHVKRAMDAGACEEEIVEAISVLMLMRGFPEEVWSRKALIKAIHSWKKDNEK
ncbi:MAG: carboxymuconolactone decarboxylase family protein [Candidatus Methanofastidiosia archaeon]